VSGGGVRRAGVGREGVGREGLVVSTTCTFMKFLAAVNSTAACPLAIFLKTWLKFQWVHIQMAEYNFYEY
jgi:hypothetical protein